MMEIEITTQFGSFYRLRVIATSMITYYDTSFSLPNKGFSRYLAIIGECSYSIYLLHLFIVFRVASIAAPYFGGNLYVALLAGAALFIGFLPVPWISYHFFERSFLALRKKYTVQ